MSLINQHTTSRRNLVHLTVSEDLDSTTYDAVIAGTELVPAGTMLTLIDASDALTTKMNIQSVAVEWDDVQLLTVSTAGVSDALAAKTEIAALTSIETADATDPATTMALVNICKAKINSVIASLKA